MARYACDDDATTKAFRDVLWKRDNDAEHIAGLLDRFQLLQATQKGDVHLAVLSSSWRMRSSISTVSKALSLASRRPTRSRPSDGAIWPLAVAQRTAPIA